MGMFDWYKPVPDLRCPICEIVLGDWQGKNADCALFLWQQGVPYPIDQITGDEECCISEEVRKQIRLPEEFEFYTSCENCPDYRIVAECKTENGVWKNVEKIRLDKKPKLPRKWFDRR